MRTALALVLALATSPAAASDWYVGVQGTLGRSAWKTDTHTTSAPWSGVGGFAGWGSRVGPLWLGAEIDAQLSSMARLATPSPPDIVWSARRWDAAVRGRVGLPLGQQDGWWALPYIAAGPSVLGSRSWGTIGSVAQTSVGWTVGAGIDVGHGPVFGRLEYRYSSYSVAGPVRRVDGSEIRMGVGIRW